MDYWTLKKKAIMGSMQSGRLAEAEGYPLKLENAIKGNMKDYKIWGNKKGKNLCPLSTYTATAGFGNNQVIYPRSTKAIQHTFSMRVASMDNAISNNVVVNVSFYYKNGSYAENNILLSKLEINKTISFKLKIVNEISRFTIITSGDLRSGTVVFDNIQLEEGGTATEYEPYEENDGLGAFGNIDVVTSGKNYLDISKIVANPSSTANVVVTEVDTSTGSIYINTVEGYASNGYCNTAKSLKSLAPHLEVGKIYCLNGTTQSSQRFIYLLSSKNYWNFGANRTITEEDLASTVIIYGLAQNKGDGTGICKIEGLSITEEASTEYEPYIEPITTTIDLTGHNSIMPNEYLDFRNGCIVRNDGTEEDIILPKIPLHKGYNILTASDAELEATKMYGKYLKKG